METSPIIAVENLGSVVPIGSKGTKKVRKKLIYMKGLNAGILETL